MRRVDFFFIQSVIADDYLSLVAKQSPSHHAHLPLMIALVHTLAHQLT